MRSIARGNKAETHRLIATKCDVVLSYMRLIAVYNTLRLGINTVIRCFCLKNIGIYTYIHTYITICRARCVDSTEYLSNQRSNLNSLTLHARMGMCLVGMGCRGDGVGTVDKYMGPGGGGKIFVRTSWAGIPTTV